MTKQVRNRGFILGRACSISEHAAECPPAERFAPFDLVLTFWPNGGLVYSSLEAPHRTTLPEKAWLSAVMSFRRRSVANLENLCRERLKGREPKKGLRSRIRSCAIMHADTKRD